jgi:hypothetical protein
MRIRGEKVSLEPLRGTCRVGAFLCSLAWLWRLTDLGKPPALLGDSRGLTLAIFSLDPRERPHLVILGGGLFG